MVKPFSDPFSISKSFEDASFLEIPEDEIDEVELTEDDQMEQEAVETMFTEDMFAGLDDVDDDDEDVEPSTETVKNETEMPSTSVSYLEAPTDEISEKDNKMELETVDDIFPDDLLNKLDEAAEREYQKEKLYQEILENPMYDLLNYKDDFFDDSVPPPNKVIIGNERPTQEEIERAERNERLKLCVHVKIHDPIWYQSQYRTKKSGNCSFLND